MSSETVGLLLIVLLLWIAAWQLRSIRQRQLLLLVASYIFYGSWGTAFLSVLVASSVMNYCLGSLLRRRLHPGWLWSGVGLNLLLLMVFKYLPPLVQEGAAGSWQAGLIGNLIMPVGISFWTFQGLSYLFDIYREEELHPSLLEFCLYMAFWPTVLSGPVCRLPDMLPQFREVHGFSMDDISIGLRRILQGLVMKFALAQMLASGLLPGEGIDAGFDTLRQDLGGMDVWLLAIGFGFQLFFDFAGYSHLVIGTARLFGIRIQENFNRPYLSLSPSVFWTRWHMSLSSWIRDYLFLPLASMRRGHWWMYVALVISMALFGLWHGARTTFILWGVYQGLLLVSHRLGQEIKGRASFHAPQFLSTVLSWGATFATISLGWILFRSSDLSQALAMFASVFAPSTYRVFHLPSSFYVLTLGVIGGYFGYELIRLFLGYLEMVHRPVTFGRTAVAVSEMVELLRERSWWWLAPMTLMALVVIGIVISQANTETSPFIYTVF